VVEERFKETYLAIRFGVLAIFCAVSSQGNKFVRAPGLFYGQSQRSCFHAQCLCRSSNTLRGSSKARVNFWTVTKEAMKGKAKDSLHVLNHPPELMTDS
jgi:hypothetical protein